MGRMISIYLDNEVAEVYDGIRSQKPDFNVSQFFKSKLLDYREDVADISVLKREIDDKNAQITKIKTEVNLIEDKIFKINTKEKLEREEQEQKRILEERKKAEFLKTHKENILFFFDISPEMAEIMAEEMWLTPKDKRKTIHEEGIERGFKEREIK